jgi:hypothetical protein
VRTGTAVGAGFGVLGEGALEADTGSRCCNHRRWLLPAKSFPPASGETRPALSSRSLHSLPLRGLDIFRSDGGASNQRNNLLPNQKPRRAL